jgi:hypothetical protein
MRKAKKQHVLLPEFSGFELGPDLGALLFAILMLLIGIPSLIGLLSYLRFLGQLTIGWVTPLGAATQSLAVGVIIWILFQRTMQLGQKNAYLALERAILVEKLSPSEIRTRFITQLLGTDVGDWLKTIEDGIAKANENLRKVTESINERFAEITAIDSQYRLERRGRAEKLVTEVAAAAAEHQSALQKCFFQMSEYTRFILTAEEQEMLKNMLGRWKAAVEDATAHKNAATELLKKLTPLVT